MGKNDFVKFPVFFKTTLALALMLGVCLGALPAQAVDLPLAASSPLSGLPFDDRPLALPVQRNFQMAMLTASSELGRSCGRMEAYGWRMGQTEQARVNQIFNASVDHLRAMGYGVAPQAPTSVSRDITMFTADRADKHFIFMWSAGELGLVMVLCEASQPYHYNNATASSPSVQVFPQPQDILQSKLDTPPRGGRPNSVSNFSPVGDWIGGYVCEQGYTGGTLQIAHLRGENFDGYFSFYPTPKNPFVPTGRYTVSGQYDKASNRILINPGKWLERPKNYYNTVMVGSFDPVNRTFSAYFQGITGCTSFEAKAATEDYVGPATTKTRKHVKKRKKVVKKKAVEAAPVTPLTPAATEATPPAPAAYAPVTPAPAVSATPADAGPASIVLPAPAAPAPTTPAAQPTTLAPASVPTITQPPATAAPLAITPPSVAPPAQVPQPTQAAPPVAPSAPPPQVAPSPTTTPLPATAPAQTPQPSGSLEPRHSPKLIQVASGEWFTPIVPQVAPAQIYNVNPPQVPQATIVPNAPLAPQAAIMVPQTPQVPPAQQLPDVVRYNTVPQTVPQPTILPPAMEAPEAERIIPNVPQVPPPQMVPNYMPPNGG